MQRETAEIWWKQVRKKLASESEEGQSDSGYETESPIKSVRVNKVEVLDHKPEQPTSTSSPSSIKKEKFDYHINDLITYPNKLVGKSNIHTVRINGAEIKRLIDTGS